MAIERLSEYTIAQIAAGEVVERPGSVVRELMDNALDAGATNIHISVVAGGKRLIRVSDDGSGISSHEAELAFTRHTTSKLRTIEDLSQIRTLGFRGEALSSIAAVSQLELVTRSREDAIGVKLRIVGGRVVEQQPAGVPAGTMVTVENLFFNTPARLKFLKSETTEKRHIAALITRYAMAYPEVRIVLEQDRREVFRSGGSGDLADVMVKVYGVDTFSHMVKVTSIDVARENRPSVKVSGYASLPESNRADRNQISLFVNGRWIQDSSLAYAVIQAYHTLLSAGRFPIVALLIEIAPQEVDVNVHPTKAEVRFRNPKAVFSAVQRAVREAIVADISPLRRTKYDSSAREYGTIWGDHNGADRLNLDWHLDHTRSSQAVFRDQSDTKDTTEIPGGPQPPLRPRTLPMLRVIGQVGARYIVAEGPVGVYLVDQGAADSRGRYEELNEELATSGKIQGYEVPPETMNLHRDEQAIVELWLEVLQELGISLESFGPSSLIIRSMPEILLNGPPGDAVGVLIGDLLAQPRVKDKAVVSEIILKRISILAAVKTGQILSLDQMQKIIRRLERCRNPLEDPYGKPTLIHLSGEQLAREFGH